ncbi:uncharacterized protein PG998_011002 [Apiospora kogelbergensis]|uniref:Uncharacterized protein n=1 Tax=Apiospora kogelbergensis TaxID=1337665 RepID=A0AAW0RDD7_9PEZI
MGPDPRNSSNCFTSFTPMPKFDIGKWEAEMKPKWEEADRRKVRTVAAPAASDWEVGAAPRSFPIPVSWHLATPLKSEH